MTVARLRTLARRLPRSFRLLVASGLATLVDTAVLLALSWTHALPAGFAAVVGCLAGGAVNFVVNRTWVFQGSDRPWAGQALRYAVIVVGGAAAVTGAAVAALSAVGLPLLAAKAAAIVLALVAWTYPMSARVVFARRARSVDPARPANARGGERGGDPDAVAVLRQSPA